MGTPATFTNPAFEAEVLKDEKLEMAYEEGHEADIPSNIGIYTAPNADLEKGEQSNVGSTHSDDRTLGAEAPAREGEETDPTIVDWDGPDDPANPMNWPEGRKWGLIAVLAAVTLVT